MPPEVVGVAEIAEMLGGVSRQRVDQLARDYADFPAPIGNLARGRVWDRADVAAWMARHPDRRGGRPKNATRGTRKEGK